MAMWECGYRTVAALPHQSRREELGKQAEVDVLAMKLAEGGYRRFAITAELASAGKSRYGV